MAKPRGNNGGAQAPEQTNPIEQPPETPAGAQGAPGGAADGPAEVAGTGQETAGEPGPEEFERHGGQRLIDDHAADLRLQGEIERRIRRRGHVIATKLRKQGVNATIEIGGIEYVARQRPRSGDEMMLSEVPRRVKATLDQLP